MKYTYRVTQVADLGDGKQLVRVKNSSGPGFVDWSGAWHPGDARWGKVDADVRARLDDGVNADGGGFWMAYGDFLKYFKVASITKK